MNFPEIIKSARESLNETQAEFAKRFDTHANTVSRWESGQYQAPYEVLDFVLSDSLKKPKADLIGCYWGNEPGYKLQVYKGVHGRVNFLLVDEVNRTSFQVSIERHNAKNLAQGLAAAINAPKESAEGGEDEKESGH